MKKLCMVFIIALIFFGIAGSFFGGVNRDEAAETVDEAAETVDEAAETVEEVYVPVEELLEREYVVGKTKEFEVPPGEVMFGEVKCFCSNSLLMECGNDENYKKETYEVLLVDEQAWSKVEYVQEGDKIAVFYDKIEEGITWKKIDPVYGIYLQRDIPNVEQFINHEIVYISKYINYAWIDEAYGWFMDKDGRVYRFEFSEDEGIECLDSDAPEAFYRSLERIRKTKEPEKVVDASVVKQILDWGSEVDASADYYGVGCAACDMGTRYELLCHPKTGEFVILKTSGDQIARLNDINAEKIVDLCEENILY